MLSSIRLFVVLLKAPKIFMGKDSIPSLSSIPNRETARGNRENAGLGFRTPRFASHLCQLCELKQVASASKSQLTYL